MNTLLIEIWTRFLKKIKHSKVRINDQLWHSLGKVQNPWRHIRGQRAHIRWIYKASISSWNVTDNRSLEASKSLKKKDNCMILFWAAHKHTTSQVFLFHFIRIFHPFHIPFVFFVELVLKEKGGVNNNINMLATVPFPCWNDLPAETRSENKWQRNNMVNERLIINKP